MNTQLMNNFLNYKSIQNNKQFIKKSSAKSLAQSN
jgi:hypothetical protein